MPVQPLSETMKQLSSYAVEFAQQQGVILDYSSESIHALEGLLGTMHSQVKEANPPAEMFAKFANIFGAYLGETFMKNIKNGEWKENTNMKALTVYINGTYIFFPAKVYRRLKDGEADNVEYMYKAEMSKFSSEK